MTLRLALILALAVAATPAHALTVRESSVIDRDKVLVGDLFDAVDIETSALPVGDAPTPGQSVAFDVYALKRVARAYNIAWAPSRLDQKAVVRRSSTPVTNAQIIDAVRAALIEKAGAGLNVDSLDIALDRRNLELHLPASVEAPQARLVDTRYSATDYRFSGTLMVEGEPGTSMQPLLVTLTGRATPTIKVPVLVRRLAAGSIIADADLDTVMLPVNKISGDAITSRENLLGRELRRDHPEGQPLHARDIRLQQLVKRGATVTMVISKGQLQVTALGRALGDGGAGDSVRVMNSISNRVIEGKVLPDGTVAIAAAI